MNLQTQTQEYIMIIQTAKQIISEVAPTLEKQYGAKLWDLNIIASKRMITTWGYAEIVNRGKGEIKLSEKIFSGKVHTKAFRNLVIHELCHIYEYQLKQKVSHSNFWKELVVVAGGLPERFTTAEERAEVGVIIGRETMTYKCDCRTHEISARTHNKILGGKLYRCKHCKTRLFKMCEN